MNHEGFGKNEPLRIPDGKPAGWAGSQQNLNPEFERLKRAVEEIDIPPELLTLSADTTDEHFIEEFEVFIDKSVGPSKLDLFGNSGRYRYAKQVYDQIRREAIETHFISRNRMITHIAQSPGEIQGDGERTNQFEMQLMELSLRSTILSLMVSKKNFEDIVGR